MAQKIIVKNPKTHLIVTPASKAYFNLKNTGGPVGATGPQGAKGDKGDAATISVGTTSTLPAGSSATVSNSGTSSAAVFNFGVPKGDKGDKGDTGSTGAAATINVGTTSTGNPGTNASVSNVGTSSAAVLNFTIPRGDKGDKGDTGDTGAAGASATIAAGTTSTLPSGSSATVTNSGTSSAAVFNFGIPKGDKGDKGDPGAGLQINGSVNTYADLPSGLGPSDAGTAYFNQADGKLYVWSGTAWPADGDGAQFQGPQGDAATIAVGTVTTGNAGTPATVTNSGTSSAAIFDFSIPKGADGQDGQDGAAATISVGTVTTGAPGSSVSVTNSGTSSAAVLDFSIPQGVAGANGQDGTAATISVGTVSTGAPGSSASVTNSGTSTAAVFDFSIPEGQPGADGQDGSDGAAATIAVGTVTTGAPGSSATVTNSGTSSAAVFDFSIPQGQPGSGVEVYTATQTSSTSTTTTYSFTPQQALSAGDTCSIVFPQPVGNYTRTVLLTDGTMAASTVLLPPVSSTYQPTYNTLTVGDINNTEPLLLYYNGTQFICMNNKQQEDFVYYDTVSPITSIGTITTNNIADGAVTPAKISYSTESTSEQVVGTWVDGKTIYKKTFTGTYNASANTTNSVFTFSGVSDIIDAKGWVSNVDAKVAFGMAHRNGTGIISDSGALLTGTTVVIRSFNNTAGSNLPYAITLYYTKS